MIKTLNEFKKTLNESFTGQDSWGTYILDENNLTLILTFNEDYFNENSDNHNMAWQLKTLSKGNNDPLGEEIATTLENDHIEVFYSNKNGKVENNTIIFKLINIKQI